MLRKLRRKLKGWKTRLFNIAGGILIALTEPHILAVLPPEWLPGIAAGVVVGNMILREFTTTPAGRGL